MAIPSQYFVFHDQLRKHNQEAKEKIRMGDDIDEAMDTMLYSMTKVICKMVSNPLQLSGVKETAPNSIKRKPADGNDESPLQKKLCKNQNSDPNKVRNGCLRCIIDDMLEWVH